MATLTDLTPGVSHHKPVALVLPGVGYTVQAPLLYWSIGILQASGWRVTAVDWTDADKGHDSPEALIEHTLDAATTAAGRQPGLIVAKSLGTLALPYSIERAIPGIWLTPLLNLESVAVALNNADDRHLAIGGAEDRHWIPEAAPATAAALIEIPDADHALRVEDWRGSLEAQSRILEQIAEHISRLAI